tara:strand:- start:821 stop:2752 length:1932 start_codon:yes stop_codon:yes gene_type:complete
MKESTGKRKTAAAKKAPAKRTTKRKTKESSEEYSPLMVSNASATNVSSPTRSRRNRSSTIQRTDKYKNIEDGIVPYKYAPGVNNKSNMEIKDAVVLCQKAYYNFSSFRNVIDLMTEFSVSDIYFKGGNKKARNFFEALFKKINIWQLQDKFFREYYRSGNVFMFRFDANLTKEDAKKITQIYADSYLQEDEITLPVKYIVLNPADIQIAGSAAFHSGVYYKVLTDYELARLKDPKTREDQELLQSLSPENKEILKKRGSSAVLLELDVDKVCAIFYKKQDYEPFAVPLGFPVLEDLNWKAELKKMDMAVSRTMQQAILLVTMGNEPDKHGINQKNIKLMQDLFANESVGRVLIADYTTKAQFVIPQVADLLDPKKYEVVDKDIQLGLNNILVGGEKFANQNAKADLFIARLTQGRQAFLNDFLIPEMKRIAKQMNLKNYPIPYFDRISLKDDSNMLRIYNRLIELGVLTAEEGLEAIDSGRLPDKESSLKSQKEFTKLKEDGLYEPLIGGGMKNDEPGRPEGTTQDQSNKSPVGEGEQSKAQFSLTKVVENVRIADGLFSKVEAALRKYHKKSRLNKAQKEVAAQITQLIIANEDSENWEESIETYIKSPIDKNLDRIHEIQDIAVEHQTDEYLASILYSSKA